MFSFIQMRPGQREQGYKLVLRGVRDKVTPPTKDEIGLQQQTAAAWPRFDTSRRVPLCRRPGTPTLPRGPLTLFAGRGDARIRPRS